MTNISSLNAYNSTDFPYRELIIYLFYTQLNLDQASDEYSKKIQFFAERYPKEINQMLRKYEYFYKEKINLGMLCQ